MVRPTTTSSVGGASVGRGRRTETPAGSGASAARKGLASGQSSPVGSGARRRTPAVGAAREKARTPGVGAPVSTSDANLALNRLSPVDPGAQTLGTELRQLGLMHNRNPHRVPYLQQQYDVNRRPFHRPTQHPDSDETNLSPVLHSSEIVALSRPQTSASSGGGALVAVSQSPTPYVSRPPTALTPAVAESDDAQPLGRPVADDAASPTQHGSSTRQRLMLTPSRQGGGSGALTGTMASTQGSSATKHHQPILLYNDRHQASCERCRDEGMKAVIAEQRVFMREYRASRGDMEGEEDEDRLELLRLYAPLHQRYLRTIVRTRARLHLAAESSRVRVALVAMQEQEAEERGVLVREGLRLQRALFRCMVRTGAERIEDLEAAARTELANVLQEEAKRAENAAVAREGRLATLAENLKQLQVIEMRRRVHAQSEELRAHTRLLLTERERRQRVAFEVQKRVEAAKAKERLAVEHDEGTARQWLNMEESDSRQALRASAVEALSQLRARIAARRLADLQRREDAGRLLKASALLQELSSSLLARVCIPLEFEHRKTVRLMEGAARQSIQRHFVVEEAQVLERLERGDTAGSAAHAVVAAEVASGVLFPWCGLGR